MRRLSIVEWLAGTAYGIVGVALAWLLGYRYSLLLWIPLHIVAAVRAAKQGFDRSSTWRLFTTLFLTQVMCIVPHRLLGFTTWPYVLGLGTMFWISCRDNDRWDLSILLTMVTVPVLASLARLLGLGAWSYLPSLLIGALSLALTDWLDKVDRKLFGYDFSRSSLRWFVRTVSLILLGLPAIVSAHIVSCYPGEGSFLTFVSNEYLPSHVMPLMDQQLDSLRKMPAFLASLSLVLRSFVASRPPLSAVLPWLAACAAFALTVPFAWGTLRVCGLSGARGKGAAPFARLGSLLGVGGAVVVAAAAVGPHEKWLGLLGFHGLPGRDLLVLGLGLGLVLAILARNLLVGMIPALALVSGHLARPSRPPDTLAIEVVVALGVWLALGTLVIALTSMRFGPAVLAWLRKSLFAEKVRKRSEPNWVTRRYECGKCGGVLPGRVARCPHCGVQFHGEKQHFVGGRPSEKTGRKRFRSFPWSKLIFWLLWFLPATALSILVWARVGDLVLAALVEGGIALTLALLILGSSARDRRLPAGDH
ncbi:MAG: hypothetical protein RBS72_11940 [Sedimentisphaerales bacterium]|nr:hypothetical protein [Sedimentisphaerales bacterium]HNY80539.1 hypothetical protein [Sedimentisphaerales bacterium]HOC63687.1 hypothetical protein [Sedimentisphaerales bacterium]HOH66306.1 hypothetical protein [Sedimentisphaerales bacterium]HQA92084.1 hypothetical protein [Sedimentisphaerales bacterium]